MSFSASVAPHIPFLRRFARALTGNQASGDAYAVATLQAFADNEAVKAGGPITRAGLYRVFLSIWGSLSVNKQVIDNDGDDQVDAADRALEGMTPLSRVAFLLRSLEGFTTAEMVEILSRDEKEVHRLIDAAGREIVSQMRTDVLIIEDEPIIAMDLESMVMDLGHDVTRIARTHKEAMTAVRDRRPGLVLADIRLADGSSGLDAVNEILMTFQVPVIFITAYPERLLTGDRPEPTFLITKPFRTDTVKAVISQALFFNRRASLTEEGTS